jgi:hypothetical protein
MVNTSREIFCFTIREFIPRSFELDTEIGQRLPLGQAVGGRILK